MEPRLPRSPCLDENTVAALLDGLLSSEDMAEVDAHVDTCVDCRLLLSNVAPLLGPAPSVVRERPSEGSISHTIEHDRVQWNASIRVGRVLKDKWRLDRLLGVGGTAAVYEATHKNHGGRVAIKVIHAGLELDPGERKRFLREGYAANAVGHPGIVRVLDDDVDDDGSLFLVSELAVGETLHARLGRLGPLPSEEVLVVAENVLDILTAAHARGIIHRDIKPENILVTSLGETKLLDFGMALVREATYEATVVSVRGLALGTPAFMPPEQALGLTDQIGPSADIWALGATMFTLLTGRLVHDARTVTEAIRRAVKLPAPPLASVFPEAPSMLAFLIDRALAFAPEDRWSSAASMQAAVRDALGGDLPMHAPPAVPSTDASRRWWAPVGASILGATVLAAWWSTRERTAPTIEPVEAAPAISASTPEPPVFEIPLESGDAPPPAAPSSEASAPGPKRPPPTARPRPSATTSVAPPTPPEAPTPPVGTSWLDRRTK